MTRHELISVEPIGIHDDHVVVRRVYTPGFLARLFGAKASVDRLAYAGRASCWFALPGLDPVGHGTIMMLCRFVDQDRVARKLKNRQPTRERQR